MAKFVWNRPNRCWVVTLESVSSKWKLKLEKTALEKISRCTNKYCTLTPVWIISQSFFCFRSPPVKMFSQFCTYRRLVFQSNQLLHHFVWYLRCFLFVDFAMCFDYRKNKMGTETNLFKQSCWAEADAAEAGKIISTKRYGIIGEPP